VEHGPLVRYSGLAAWGRIPEADETRQDGWSGWDFERIRDKSRLEVKQSAARQAWSVPRNLRTRGTFDIAARTGISSKAAPSMNPPKVRSFFRPRPDGQAVKMEHIL